MGLMCFTKHEPVGVVGQIIPVSYFYVGCLFIYFPWESKVGWLTEIFSLKKKNEMLRRIVPYLFGFFYYCSGISHLV